MKFLAPQLVPIADWYPKEVWTQTPENWVRLREWSAGYRFPSVRRCCTTSIYSLVSSG